VSANRIAAAAVVAVAAVLFALTFGFEKMPLGLSGGFGAEAFPRLVLGVIAGLALLLFATGRVSEPQPPVPRMVYFTGASLLAFMALVPLAGMLPAMFLFQLGLAYLWGERRHLLVLSIAAATTALLWAVFVRGFGIQLPKGVFT
jgi:asparagine N-glycosylation enzyme membrane subunit Stt3